MVDGRGKARGGTGYEKVGERKISGPKRRKNFCSCPPTVPVCPLPTYWGHMPFCHPVEAIHAVTMMSLKAIGLQSTCRPAVRFVSFHRISVGPQGVNPLKSGTAKTYSRPLASKSGGAFALPGLQLVPPWGQLPLFSPLWQGRRSWGLGC